MLNTFIFYYLAMFSMQNIHNEKPERDAAERPIPASLFSGHRRATVIAFSRRAISKRSTERNSFETVWGRCGDSIPLGWVAENRKGSKRGRDAMCPSPRTGRKQSAAKFRRL